MNDVWKSPQLVAILRGISPEQALGVVEVLWNAGIRIVEVPLNSPKPLESISKISKRFGADMLVGAGTVLSPDEVSAVSDAGGRLIVSPHCGLDVIERAMRLELIAVPGVFTMTEAIRAIGAGANILKLFPADVLAPNGIKGMRAVLPKDIRLIPVGGVSAKTIPKYIEAGASALGIGSSLYSPTKSLKEISMAAVEMQSVLTQTVSQQIP